MTKTNTFNRGLYAEAIGKILLRMKGFSILVQRYSCPVGEIDLIARRDDLLLFVEVKHRKDPSSALTALDRKQQRRIARAADVYLQDHIHDRDLKYRFDLIAVSPWMLPRHIEDIWRPSRN